MILTIDTHLSYEGNNYIEKPVNYTVLGNCLYFNDQNITSIPNKDAKSYTEQYKNFCLLQTISQEGRNKIINNCKDIKINIRIFEDFDRKNLLTTEQCAFSHASRAYTISFPNTIKIIMQKLFPINTSLAIAFQNIKKKPSINEESIFYESIGISPYVEKNGNGGFDIFPIKRIDKANIKDSDISLLLTIAEDYSEGLFLNTAPQKGKDAKKHKNAFSDSTAWYNAEEFARKWTSKKNCIYTLASEPDAKGKCNIYIGEAKVSGNRLKVFRTNLGTFIDHTKEEAIQPNRRFTRFRIDMLKPDAHEFLHDAQDSCIGVVHMIQHECPNGYNIVNDKKHGLCSSISDASSKDFEMRKKE